MQNQKMSTLQLQSLNNSGLSETEPARGALILVSPSGLILVHNFLLTPRTELGRELYYYRTQSGDATRHLSYRSASSRIIEVLDPKYLPNSWDKGLLNSDLSRYGYNTFAGQNERNYSLTIWHDLIKNEYNIQPFSYLGRYFGERQQGDPVFTIPADSVSLNFATSIEQAINFIESKTRIPDKYRTLPKNTNKLIAKWRKDHPDDPRTLWDMENDRREGIDTV